MEQDFIGAKGNNTPSGGIWIRSSSHFSKASVSLPCIFLVLGNHQGAV